LPRFTKTTGTCSILTPQRLGAPDLSQKLIDLNWSLAPLTRQSSVPRSLSHLAIRTYPSFPKGLSESMSILQNWKL